MCQTLHCTASRPFLGTRNVAQPPSAVAIAGHSRGGCATLGGCATSSFNKRTGRRIVKDSLALMAQFVNYKKRDFTLSPGCKDLIDVLTTSGRQAKRHVACSGSPRPKIREDRFATFGLPQIERYVSMLVQPRREFSLLRVTSQKLHFSVWLHRFRTQPLGAIALINEDAQREQAIRAFFEQQGIKSSLDKSSVSGAADGAGYLVYPLPSDASGVIRLTTELLRNVYGVDDEGLDFYCYED